MRGPNSIRILKKTNVMNRLSKKKMYLFLSLFSEYYETIQIMIRSVDFYLCSVTRLIGHFLRSFIRTNYPKNSFCFPMVGPP